MTSKIVMFSLTLILRGRGGLEVHSEVYSEVHSDFHSPLSTLVQSSLQLWVLDLVEWICPQPETNPEQREPILMLTIETDQGQFLLKVTPTKAHFRSGTAVGRCWAALEDHNGESIEIHTVLPGFWQVAQNGGGWGLGGGLQSVP